MADLFQYAAEQEQPHTQPLATRMRPRSLDEFVGQTDLVGPGRPLRRALEQGRGFPALILWGPPGTGKTTLAYLLAQSFDAHVARLSAVLAGKADLLKVIDQAREQRRLYGRPTVLFIDEVHRWNRAQQDALLPYLEDGTLHFIGATTENPYFALVPALLSRAQVFQLEPLSEEAILTLLRRALTDPRGYGGQPVQVDEDALRYLAAAAQGDARRALNALELAVESAAPDAQGRRHVDLAWARAVLQRPALRYDRDRDAHYDTISAFIKSVRGSDPDAALYYLAVMIEAGEDPRFILRRLLILAAEDVGLADPNALVVVQAAAQAFERTGMPEGIYFLSQATLYLATAPKSNSTKAVFQAQAYVREHGAGEVPLPLRDASRDREALGHGQGYRYPHDEPGHFVRQVYLPAEARDAHFYEPSDQGYEAQVWERLRRWWPDRWPGAEASTDEVES
ncbi:MAG: replication-associated recombination protein A [Chloroflexi bacterium]|nr:replication-associated recombination protein A [Chloroflexota bacterium]